MTEPKHACVLVSGDFVLDHHIYEGQRHHFGDRRHRGVQEKEELGGAALIHYLLVALKGNVDSHLTVSLDENRLPNTASEFLPSRAVSAYAAWKPYDRENGKSSESRVWRIADAMGFGGELDPDDAKGRGWPLALKLPQTPDVVVLSDGGMGFRDDPTRWPDKTALDHARWIVLKTTNPLADGALWECLSQPVYRTKLVIVVSADELRKSPARISTGLSWDATIESVMEALAPDGELTALTHCRHLLLAFGTEGGLWLDLGPTPSDNRSHFIYDAGVIEGEHWHVGQGTAFGALSCLTAATAWYLARGGDTPDLESALEGGLSAIYDLFDQGHGRSSAPGEGFPAVRLARAVKEATCRYSRIVIPFDAVSAKPACASKTLPATNTSCWSILHETLRQQGLNCPEPAWALAERITLRGPIALGSLPHLSIGNLMSADRREVESLRVLRRLIDDYKNRKVCKKPLSIGVFGPPGAGKSFAVKEIAQALVGKNEWFEFNLSQFKTGTEDLIGAFHQIRDRVLKNQIPVAFFDEFDSRDYVWLQYLLAPMQDGAFQEGQITHPIGKCILVFAGGTSWTFDSFGPPAGDVDALARFRMAKGPDFKSRLDGFLDVLGPNRRQIISVSSDTLSYVRTPDLCDIFYPVRRSFVIRSELGCKSTDKLAMDGGLLHALLRVENYTHGSRSLSKVIEPLKVALPGPIHRSLIAPRQQLALHVDADAFLKASRLLRKAEMPVPNWDTSTREQVAQAVHSTWNKLGLERGWLDAKTVVEFGSLTHFFQDSNRAAADRMFKTLLLVGLTLEAGENVPAELEALRLKLEYNLELLAEAEHDGWMDWHLDQGWQWGPGKKDLEKKTHPCLKPYIQLSAIERDKDRDSIRHYLSFAQMSGMKIVTLETASLARSSVHEKAEMTKESTT